MRIEHTPGLVRAHGEPNMDSGYRLRKLLDRLPRHCVLNGREVRHPHIFPAMLHVTSRGQTAELRY